jgi:hypothetical protein
MLRETLSAYIDAFDVPQKSGTTRDSSAATSAKVLSLEIRKFSARIYCPPAMQRAAADVGRGIKAVGMNAGGILLEQSNDGSTQARVDWITADLSESKCKRARAIHLSLTLTSCMKLSTRRHGSLVVIPPVLAIWTRLWIYDTCRTGRNGSPWSYLSCHSTWTKPYRINFSTLSTT